MVVGGVAPPSFSQVTLGRGTPLALHDSVTSFHSRAETAGEGSERMEEFAIHEGIIKININCCDSSYTTFVR